MIIRLNPEQGPVLHSHTPTSITLLACFLAVWATSFVPMSLVLSLSRSLSPTHNRREILTHNIESIFPKPPWPPIQISAYLPDPHLQVVLRDLLLLAICVFHFLSAEPCLQRRQASDPDQTSKDVYLQALTRTIQTQPDTRMMRIEAQFRAH